MQPVGVLEQDEQHAYRFYYIERARTVDGFRPFLGFPTLDRTYTSPTLFPLFAQRVMHPRRPDYQDYLDTLALSGEPSPMEVLARSRGQRVGDTIQLFPEPSIAADGSTSCLFLVHGVRHIPGADERIARLQPGDELRLVDDPTNEANPRAVLVAADGTGRLGWVPDLLLGYVHTVQEHGPVDVRVVRANGPDAPPHMRLLARLSGTAPPDYRPFIGSGWKPLA